ncbi:MAG: AraC family transcriptional regulator [Planctomycetota bacterium]|nr:AraC family transcriptional regulator [Planctomycetota bacterium]
MLESNYDLSLDKGGYYVCTPTWETKAPETIYEHRFYFTLKGRAALEVSGHGHDLRAARIYFVPGHQPVGRACARRLELYWLHFRPLSPLLDFRLGRLPLYEWPLRRWQAWEPVYGKLPQYFEGRMETLGLRVRALLHMLLAEMLEQRADLEATLTARRAMQALEPAVAYMDAHFRENPKLKRVAAQVHLSPVHFHRRFGAAFGQTPHQYMERRRMQAARELLLGGGERVKEIAEACGYENPFYFSRAFRRAYGVSPRELRKKETERKP